MKTKIQKRMEREIKIKKTEKLFQYKIIKHLLLFLIEK